MTGMLGEVRDALHRDVDMDRLLTRVEAVERFLAATADHLPDSRLVAARTVVERAGARLARSRDHTVVALAGATGSGKSSLFNALIGHNLSSVGIRRPTTGVTHACVFGQLSGATELLDWIGVPPRHRYVLESDRDEDARLRGLVLLDCPDFDSVEWTHRAEVNRLLDLVDLVVWVVDPQKYADRLVHRTYLHEFRRHREVTVVVLNQADLLAPDDRQRVLGDLRRLLDDDGLEGVPLLATSAFDPASVDGLRTSLERVVADRRAALSRLAADIDAVAEELSELAGPAVGDVDTDTERRLADALATSAGVPTVVEAVEAAYRHRAGIETGWPLARGFRRLRPDPLRRLHLADGPADASAESVATASSVPAPSAAQRAAAGLAVRDVAEAAGAGLPEVWRSAVATAASSRLDDLPDALDRVLVTTDLGVNRRRVWWRLVKAVQTLFAGLAVVGCGWLVVGFVIRLLELPPLDYPMVGPVPLPTALLAAGLVAGLLLAVLLRPVVAAAAQRARQRAEDRLRAAVVEVGQEYVVAPVRGVLRSYVAAREALNDMTR